jgi:hypothetical protein
MTRTKRFATVSLHTLAAAFWLGTMGCSDGSNEPSTKPGSGSATTGATSGTSTTSGAGGTATTSGAGGSGTTSGTGGTGTTGGAPGTGGGVAPDGGGNFTPLCSAVPLTAAGVAPTKGGVCTATDAQLCYKTCGPLSIGFKSETCTAGLYVEESGCHFPDQDYSCYKIPTAISATCPTTVPQASQPCTVAECVLCNVAGNYLDSGGASKVGYCVCPAAGASGTSKWSCASTTAWPCPAGRGC